jgi:hypothetical protein
MSKNIKIDNIVAELRTAANAARETGDVLTALAIEQSIAELKNDLPKILPLIAGLTFQTSTPRDPEMDAAKWSLLKPKAIHAAELASIIDCGEKGRITIIGGAILIKGSIAMEPMTALLIADHAKRNLNGQGIAFGCQEFMHNIAVVNAAMGTTLEGLQYAEYDKAYIHATARGWQPMVHAIHTVAPSQPVGRTAKAASIAITPEPVCRQGVTLLCRLSALVACQILSKIAEKSG